MTAWQLQQAKAKLTELVRKSQTEPQIISRHGVNEAVLISMQQYTKFMSNKQSAMDFFRNSPLHGIKLDIERDQSFDREIDL